MYRRLVSFAVSFLCVIAHFGKKKALWIMSISAHSQRAFLEGA
jgi:hypothetical protein